MSISGQPRKQRKSCGAADVLGPNEFGFGKWGHFLWGEDWMGCIYLGFGGILPKVLGNFREKRESWFLLQNGLWALLNTPKA